MARHLVAVKRRERRENRRRLRHCIGLQAPNGHCSVCRRKNGKAGVRFEIRSQDIRLIALVRLPREGWALLRKEKDEASLPICFRRDSLNAFIPRFAGE